MTELSVITVSFNRKDMLLKKLESLRKQTLVADKFEWILLINGSTDGTKDILQDVDTAFQTTVIVPGKNISIGEARNACCEKAKGTVLYFSDDDCVLEENTLEHHLDAQGTPAVAIGGILFESESKELWQPGKVSFWNLNGANSSVPKETFKEVGGFDKRIQGYGGEDLLLGYKLHKAGLTFKAIRNHVTHLGSNPMRGGNVEKARSAGRNAAKIARLYPELAYRLGVSPLLMNLKQVSFNPLTNKFLNLFNSSSLAYEQAYFEGAKEERKRHG